MREREFGKLVKVDLVAFLQASKAMPFIAYDTSADSVIILDSWTRFVLKMERDSVCRSVRVIADRAAAD